MNEWDRRDRETGKAYSAFSSYLELEDRSLVKLSKKLGKSSGYTRQLQEWSGLFEWVERAAAWDAYVASEARRKTEHHLIERRSQIQEREWSASETLIKRAEEINKLPLTQRVLNDTQESPDGKTIINYYTIEPIRTAARDVVRMLDLASKLGRLSTGLETDRIKIDMEVQAQLEELLSELRGALSPAAIGEIEAYLSARLGEGSPERISN